MRKIIKIDVKSNFIINCTFDNSEDRIIDLEKILDKNDKYASKVFDDKIFRKVKIGSQGELFWEGIAEMKNLNNENIPCEYDICPDFVYQNSESLSTAQIP